MKKNFIYALLGAIALTGAASLTACSSSDEIVDNPNYNPETNTVKTQFAISIPIKDVQATRMAAAGAPDNGQFFGMKEIHLYPISGTTDVNGATASSTISTPILLGGIANDGLDKTGTSSNFHGKVYEDVAVPVGTKAFLFYGEISNENGGDLTTTYGTSGDPTAVNFALVPIQSSVTMATVNSDTQGSAVLTALNAIDDVLVTQEASAASTQMNALLQAFHTLKAGSANSVQVFMQNVYNNLVGIGGEKATAVQNKIKEYFNVSGDASPYALTWKTTNTFPNNIDLPDGAIGLKYENNDFAFSQVTVSGNSQPELNTYVKPASLFYYVNTPIHTSTVAHESEYNSKENWSDVVALYNAGTEVTSSTRGIVLDNPIQYGVGRLKSQVQIKSGTTLKAYDENGGDAVVTAPTEGYTVSAVLIGGQKNVDWKFEPTNVDTKYTIYDPVQTTSGTKASTTASAANYTLALQTAKDEKIKVVVELINEGEKFYGIENHLIPTGSKFYLIAELDPTVVTGTGGYDANDDTKNRVFCQDVETEVLFTIGENSLKKAYNTIPDLRAPKMELGLSVDLNWKPGLHFNIEI